MRRGLVAGAVLGVGALLLSACDLGRPPVVYDNVPGRDIASGDVNGDGRIDLVTAGFRQSNSGGIARLDYTVLIADAAGGFTPEYVDEDQDSQTETMKVALADIDDDGDLDLLRAYEHVVDGIYDEDLAVSRNDGAGHFALPEILPNPAVVDQMSGIETGDVNDDGAVDVVVATSVPAVHVYLGDGSGSLLPPVAVEVPMTDEPVYMLDEIGIADLDADGNADIVANGTRCVHTPDVPPTCGPDGSPSAALFVLHGDGTGTTWSHQVVPGGSAPESGTTGLVVGDLDGDGRPDVATASGTVVAVWLAGPDGAFRPGRIWQTGIDSCPTLHDIAGDDVDGDGHLDIAVVTQCGDGAVLFGDGQGGRRSARPLDFALPDQTGGHTLIADDLTGDGQPDLAVGSSPFCPCNQQRPQVAVMVNALGSG